MKTFKVRGVQLRFEAEEIDGRMMLVYWTPGEDPSTDDEPWIVGGVDSDGEVDFDEGPHPYGENEP